MSNFEMLVVCILLFLTFITILFTAIYNFVELKINKDIKLKAIEALKSNVELKINSQDLKELLK